MTASFALLGATSAYAYQIKNVDTDVKNDFVLEPAKIEVTLNPGEHEVRNFTITNRTANTRNFTVSMEDFSGSQDPSKTVILYGLDKGPFSLMKYLTPEVFEFTLKSKEQIILPVTISVPSNAEPGGLYGSVLFSSIPTPPKDKAQAPSTVNISRLGALFLVRVNGKVHEEGALEDFRIKSGKSVFFKSEPITFEFLYRNMGSIHLNPYGVVEISNIAGVTTDKIDILPYFSMPDSLRSREVQWERTLLLGRYKATARINRGYGDIIDEKSLVFWVIPWKVLGAGLLSIMVLVLIIKWLTSRFEFRRKI